MEGKCLPLGSKKKKSSNLLFPATMSNAEDVVVVDAFTPRRGEMMKVAMVVAVWLIESPIDRENCSRPPIEVTAGERSEEGQKERDLPEQ